MEKNKLLDKEGLVDLSGLLNNLYEERDCVIRNKMVIGFYEIEEFLKNVMSKYLEQNPETTALDIIKKESSIFLIFNNCCVKEDCTSHPYYSLYKQTTFEIVIEHFAKKKIKPTIKEYEEIYQKYFDAKSDPEYNSAFMEHIIQSYEFKKHKHFGSNPDGKINEFKQKCFINTEEKDSTEEETTADN